VGKRISGFEKMMFVGKALASCLAKTRPGLYRPGSACDNCLSEIVRRALPSSKNPFPSYDKVCGPLLLHTLHRATTSAKGAGGRALQSTRKGSGAEVRRLVPLRGRQEEGVLPGRSNVARIAQRQSSKTVAAASATKVIPPVPEPQWSQLFAHALRCGIPMVGFGIIDNLVMITAGERIQSSIGITLGLTTMAAAGLGQVVSDISGIMSGGTVDALVGRLLPNLPRSNLTSLQKDLTSSRVAQTVGGCVGVTIGCLLGMSVLFFIDTEALERQRTAAELEGIFDLVERSAMDTADRILGAEMSILWLVDREDEDTIWTRVVADGDVPSDQEIKKTDFVSVVRRTDSSQNIVKKTIQSKTVQHISLKGEGVIKNMMTAPILGGDGRILGAIQIVNKRESAGGGFDRHDADILNVLCAHIASFVEILESYSE